MAAPRESAEPAVSNFLLGIEMTEKAIQSAFERNGLKRISPEKGAKFDPHLHQAMMEQDDPEAEPGTVSQTMQPGYELFGRIVRPAMGAVTPKFTTATSAASAEVLLRRFAQCLSSIRNLTGPSRSPRSRRVRYR